VKKNRHGTALAAATAATISNFMPFLPSAFDVINKSAGAGGVKATRDLAYGAHPRQRVDFYQPKRGKAPAPVIVFFYGGSWQSGNRADYAFVAAALVRQGFVVAIPDYRVYPEVKFPDFLEDAAASVAFVMNHAAAHGGAADEVFLMGHSAGAYNAVMLALAPVFLREAGSSPRRLAGVIGLSGPYDFLPLRDPVLKVIFSPPDDVRNTQPISYAHGEAPPLLLLHGGADITVLPRNTTALAAKLRAAGGIVETKIYPALGHVGMILSLLPWLAWRAPVFADVLAFCAAARAGEYAQAHSETQRRKVG
jgi:acetyl esterase/lipase